MADNAVHAAGAVVTRGDGAERHFLVVHRSYRSDWTFPKGKVDPGEHILAAAVREVREETGLAVRLGVPLPSTRYAVDGLPKVSHYWFATELSGQFSPNDEVDEARWVTLSEARELLSYERDVDVLEAAALAHTTIPLVVLRHTQAMKRAEWAASGKSTAGVDQRRPLTAVGRMQAQSLVPALAALALDAIHASDSIRCRDTVGPLASARGLHVEAHHALSEEGHARNPQATSALIAQLALDPHSVVVCTHRPVMPEVMSTLTQTLALVDQDGAALDPALTPGSLAVFHRDPRDTARVVAWQRLKR